MNHIMTDGDRICFSVNVWLAPHVRQFILPSYSPAYRCLTRRNNATFSGMCAVVLMLLTHCKGYANDLVGT